MLEYALSLSLFFFLFSLFLTLIDQVSTQIVEHTGTRLIILLSPSRLDKVAETVKVGLVFNQSTKMAAGYKLLDGQKVTIPSAVLVNAADLASLLRDLA